MEGATVEVYSNVTSSVEVIYLSPPYVCKSGIVSIIIKS